LAASVRRDRRLSSLLVIAAIGLGLGAGFALEPVEIAGETALTLGPVRLPSVCWFRDGTGIPCASCGITRSVVLLLHGRLRDSRESHPFGWAIVALALLAIVPRAAVAAGHERGWVRRFDRIWLALAIGTLVLMIAFWALGLGLSWISSGHLP